MEQQQQQNSGLSYDQLMAELQKNPEILHAAAAKMGTRLAPIGQQGGQQQEQKGPQRPKFDFESISNVEEFTAALQKALDSAMDYVDQSFLHRDERGRQEKIQQTTETKAKEVREFAKTHPDFKELIPIMDPLWMSGKYTLDEAYSIAKGGAKKQDEKTTETKSQETPPASSLRSSEGLRSQSEEQKVTSLKPQGVKDSVRKNLDKYLAEHGPEGLGTT